MKSSPRGRTFPFPRNRTVVLSAILLPLVSLGCGGSGAPGAELPDLVITRARVLDVRSAEGSASVAPPADQQALVADAGFARGPLASCPTDLRWLNHISGWQVQWPATLVGQPVDTQERREAFLSRWTSGPVALDAAVDSLRAGLQRGEAAPALVVRRVLEQIDGLLAFPGAESPLLAPAWRSDVPEFVRHWRGFVSDGLEPAIRRYRRFLAEAYLPEAAEALGLGRLPSGETCFQEAVVWWTTLRAPSREIEDRGRESLAVLERKLLELAAPAYGSRREDILVRLRTGDLAGGFASREDVVLHAEAAIERARRALPLWIGTPVAAPVEVVPMPRNLESSFPAGFYRQPNALRPAAYVVNTSRPGDRRLLSEAVAFHEAIPGHHVSSALSAAAGTAGGAFSGGFVEGWAIYAERLAAEMGLYSAALDRIGLVTKHLWATSRLIVEPGIHVYGWTRDEAIRYMLEHTALPREEIEVEVDRYVAMPGQSLSYMLGYLELRRLRQEAERRMGEDFDIRGFHDTVLLPGPRPLREVAVDVERWARHTSGGPEP